MKKLIIAAIAVCAISCTKTKTITLTAPAVHDTTVIHDTAVFIPTLVGRWTNNVSSNLKPTFTGDSLTWTGLPAFRYVETPDTFYTYYGNGTIYRQYAYKISPKNDTLTLYQLPPSSGTMVFWRM